MATASHPKKKIPAHLAACCQTKNPLYLDEGEWTVVDGVFQKPKQGELVAHEVITNGTASVTVRGPVRVVSFGKSSVRAEEESLVHSFDTSRITAMPGAEVHAYMTSQIDARPSSHIWSVRQKPTITAHTNAIVIVMSESKPKINLRGEPTVVNFRYKEIPEAA